MNNPIALTVTAVFLWSILNVCLERWLSRISPQFMVFVVGGMMMIAMATSIFFTKGKLVSPNVNEWWVILVCGAVWTVADFLYVRAYHVEGKLIVMTTILIMLPVAASIMKIAVGGELPTLRQLAGWACAVAAVFLVSK